MCNLPWLSSRLSDYLVQLREIYYSGKANLPATTNTQGTRKYCPRRKILTAQQCDTRA